MTLITEYDPPDGIALYHLSTFADIGKKKGKSFCLFWNKIFCIIRC